MKQLIKITEQNGKRAVSAKKLHQLLGIKKPPVYWIKQQIIKYGFIENIHFQTVIQYVRHSNGMGGTHKKDYYLNIDTAKEIAMKSRTQKGQNIWLYLNNMGELGDVCTEQESSIVTKRNELIDLIGYYLNPGDDIIVAKKTGYSVSYVKSVLYKQRNNEKIIRTLYELAIYNKMELSHDEMINTLKE